MAEDEPIKKMSIICSKGSLDMAYPGLILANAARMSGIEVNMFFTFWGLDIITKKRMNRLKVGTVGNPAMRLPGNLPFPTWMGAIPFMSHIATWMMRKEIARLDQPPVGEYIEMLHDAGAKLYGCKMAAEMMKIERDDLADEVDDIIGAMEFYEVSAGAQMIFI